ncbi:unnamed protein product [Calypogeia fissa]
MNEMPDLHMGLVSTAVYGVTLAGSRAAGEEYHRRTWPRLVPKQRPLPKLSWARYGARGRAGLGSPVRTELPVNAREPLTNHPQTTALPGSLGGRSSLQENVC